LGAGHTIDQEHLLVLSVHGRLHGILQKLDGDLHGNDGALLDVCLDHLAKLAASAVLLLAQQVARTQVLEAVVGDKLDALRSLACARAAEHEDDGDIVGGPQGGSARGGAEVLDSGHDGGVI
jgi:hypothetical protein